MTLAHTPERCGRMDCPGCNPLTEEEHKAGCVNVPPHETQPGVRVGGGDGARCWWCPSPSAKYDSKGRGVCGDCAHETQPGVERVCPAAQYGGCGNADCGPCNAMGMAEITDGLDRWLTEVKTRGYVAATLRLPPRSGSTEATSGEWPSWALAERAVAPADPHVSPRLHSPEWVAIQEAANLRASRMMHNVHGLYGSTLDASHEPLTPTTMAKAAQVAREADERERAEELRLSLGNEPLFRPGEIVVGESWVIDDPMPLGPLAEEQRKAVVGRYGKHEPLFRPGDLHYSGVAVPEEQAKDLTFEQVMALANGDNDAWEQACAAVGRAALTTGAVLFGSDKPGPATVVAAQQGCAAVEADTNIRCTNSTRPGYAFCDGKCRFVAPIEPGTKCSQCWLPAVVRDGAGYACCEGCGG